MTHGSLFSGIGGFDLAAQWMGWQNLFHCEIEEFPRKILSHYWPNAKSYEDITKTDFTIWRGKIDVLTGGFPCQPYSQAGKRLGKADDRHLWPHMRRAIREIQPKWVVGENVFGIVNWNAGLVFDEVQADLEVEGYEVQTYVLPAAALNAPHRRDRVWFVAHRKGKSTTANAPRNGSGGTSRETGEKTGRQKRYKAEQPAIGRKIWATAHPASNGRAYRHPQTRRTHPGGQKRRVQQFTGKGTRTFAHANRERFQKFHPAHKPKGKEQRAGRNIAGNASHTNRFGRRRLRNEGKTPRAPKSNELLGSQCGISNQRLDTHSHGGAARPPRAGAKTGGSWRGNLGKPQERRKQAQQRFGRRDVPQNEGNVAHAQRSGRPQNNGQGKPGQPNETCPGNNWQNFPTQSPICGGNDGFSAFMDSNAVFKKLGIDHPRQPAIGFRKWRNESIKAYGNAVVPQVVLQVFRAIEKYEKI